MVSGLAGDYWRDPLRVSWCVQDLLPGFQCRPVCCAANHRLITRAADRDDTGRSSGAGSRVPAELRECVELRVAARMERSGATG